jgi:hypothetical protein
MEKIYEKIPGLGTGRGGLQLAMRSRMYRGPDHLLIVQSTGYTEEYKRVFFRDIRYVEVRETQGQLVSTIVSGVLTSGLAFLYFAHEIPIIGIILICAPFAVWFILNLVWGPTVVCHISTNVQTLKLPTPRRRKQVGVLIDFLREQTAAFEPIENAQPSV